MAKLEDIRRALAKAQADLAEKKEFVPSPSSEYGGGTTRNPQYTNLQAAIKRLTKALALEEAKATAADPAAPEEERKRAQSEVDSQRKAAESNMSVYRQGKEQTNKDLGAILGEITEETAKQETLAAALDEDFPKAKEAVEPKPTAAPPVPAPPVPASPPAAAAPKPAAPVPTPNDVKELDEDVKAIRAERLKRQELKTKQMEREVEEADKAADQREYNALTPAQKLELDVRSREQQKAANARGAVEARREQLAADEEYKGMQIASSGSFKRGDVTQYVDPTERAAAQSYFTKRAADIRAGEDPAVRAKGGQFTAGPAPTFSGDRSLTVMDIDPRYGGGKATGASPGFAGGAKFGPDPNTMASEMIGGKPVPIMTVGQAYSTQSRGPGINQYEKAGTIPQQLDARSARGIRDVATKQMVDEQIEYALTGKLPPRLEEERRKRLQEEQRNKENAAINAGPANPKSQYA